MNIASLSLDSVGRESSGHKQSVNKHRKSARGGREGKREVGGGSVTGYVWARQTEKNTLCPLFP